MRFISWQRAITTLMSLLAVCSFGSSARASDVLKNQVYNDKLPDCCVGDIYQPAAEDGRALPAVILVHGGSWSAGSKDDPEILDITKALVGKGFVVFDINYRLLGQGGTFPNNIDDVKSAVCFLAQCSASFRIDPSRISILGVSAGGYLALMSAYMPGPAREHLKAAVGLCPATDLSRVAPSLVNAYLGAQLRKSSKKLKLTSALTFVKTGIPTMLLHGTADQVISFEQSARLEHALRKAKIAVELVAIKDADHSFILKPGDEHDRALANIERFLQAQSALRNGHGE